VLRQDGAPDACFELSRGAAPRRLPDPAPAAAAAEAPAASVRDDGAGPAACAGSRCKPLGATIRAALARAKALGEGGYTTPRVTGDLRLLAVENQLFSIADDRRVRPRPPADLPPSPAPPRLAAIELAGDLAIASWATCAGPCLVAAAVDARGASRGRSFPGGTPVALDDRRVAILPMEARAAVTVLDRATGQPLGEAAIHDGTSHGMIGVAADAQTLVALTATQAPAGWTSSGWRRRPARRRPSRRGRRSRAARSRRRGEIRPREPFTACRRLSSPSSRTAPRVPKRPALERFEATGLTYACGRSCPPRHARRRDHAIGNRICTAEQHARRDDRAVEQPGYQERPLRERSIRHDAPPASCT